MNKFTKWFIASLSLALISLVVVFNVEDWARVTGEMKRSALLIGILSTYLLVIVSLFCLIKANAERQITKIVISLFTLLIPLSVFVLNTVIFTIYFIGK